MSKSRDARNNANSVTSESSSLWSMRWIHVFKLTNLNESDVSPLGKRIPLAKFPIPSDGVLPGEFAI